MSVDILNILPGKKRHTPSGWWAFNAICCHRRGHRADTRTRGGVMFDGADWIYNCFNCGFKCGVKIGKLYTKNTVELLQWCGMDDAEIKRLSLESYAQRDLSDVLSQKAKPFIATFEDRPLSDTAVPLDEHDPQHQIHVDYLRGRGLTPESYSYYIDPQNSRPGIMLPYYYAGRIVGNTCRFYDGRAPKYIKDSQSGYVFNIDAQVPERSVCILVEGEFDAISIGGCAYMGSTISDQQSQLINRLGKRVIVVPDHDAAGLKICDRALELGYSVSIPQWEDDIKDVNDAVARYGRLTTLLSILECATTSQAKVKITRNKII